jgi:hypothetical protein
VVTTSEQEDRSHGVFVFNPAGATPAIPRGCAMLFRIMLLLLSLLPLFATKGDDDADDDPGDQDDDTDDQGDPDDDEPLGDKGKKALQRERDRADAEERKRKDAERQLRALQKKQREAEEAAAKDEGDYKSLYDDLKTKFDALESERETEKLTANRERIARKHQIPDDLLDLVRGDTDEEIEASVKKLAKHVNPGAVDTEAGSGRKGQAQTTKGAPRQLDDPAPKQDEKQPQYPFVPDGAVVIID